MWGPSGCVSLLNQFKFSPLQPDLALARAIQAETVPDCDLGQCDQHGVRKPGAPPLPPSKSPGGKLKNGESSGSSVVSSSGGPSVGSGCGGSGGADSSHPTNGQRSGSGEGEGEENCSDVVSASTTTIPGKPPTPPTSSSSGGSGGGSTRSSGEGQSSGSPSQRQSSRGGDGSVSGGGGGDGGGGGSSSTNSKNNNNNNNNNNKNSRVEAEAELARTLEQEKLCINALKASPLSIFSPRFDFDETLQAAAASSSSAISPPLLTYSASTSATTTNAQPPSPSQHQQQQPSQIAVTTQSSTATLHTTSPPPSSLAQALARQQVSDHRLMSLYWIPTSPPPTPSLPLTWSIYSFIHPRILSFSNNLRTHVFFVTYYSSPSTFSSCPPPPPPHAPLHRRMVDWLIDWLISLDWGKQPCTRGRYDHSTGHRTRYPPIIRTYIYHPLTSSDIIFPYHLLFLSSHTIIP